MKDINLNSESFVADIGSIIKPFCRLLLFAVMIISLAVSAVNAAETVLIVPQGNQPLLSFAAGELQRYIYLRTGILAEINDSATPQQNTITTIRLLVDSKTLLPEEYELKTENENKTLTVRGGSELGVLYGAYRFAEHLGVRFYLHGDVIPDAKVPFALPNLDEKNKPLFELRGLNPWGSHPHGFDQWNADDYIVHIGQLAKMRMNFIGMHCYPEKAPFAEPTVWIGREGDFNPDGSVKFSYPSNYFSTTTKNSPWGIIAGTTDAYSFGADKLFPEKIFGTDVMKGLSPIPQTPEDCNRLFNNVGKQFAKAFSFARQVGVKTCIGTEAPLTIPQLVRDKIKADGKDPNDPATVKEIYKSIFRRIAATHPLDYYWIWTEENWTWRGNKQDAADRVIADILIAHQALDEIGRPFQLATAGWVVGPADDRSLLDKKLPANIAISSISRDLGHTPVDEAYGRIERKSKWAIPWMESDHYHGLNDPQIFVARTRKDAADALAYGCNGLMGLHWRTEELSPNIAALAQAAWSQDKWNPSLGKILPNKPLTNNPLRLGNSNRGLESIDFWRDWAENMFGKEVAEDAAKIFHAIDGRLEVILERDCPAGRLSPYHGEWEKVKHPVDFVDDFCNLRTKIQSAGNLERFLFWQNFFLYYRQQGELRCTLGKFDTLVKTIEAEKDDAVKKERADKELFPVFAEIVKQYGAMMTYLQETVTTNGGLMTIVFSEQGNYWRKVALDSPRQRLVKLSGREVTAESDIWRDYRGRARIFVTTIRTSAQDGEEITLPVKIHSPQSPTQTTLNWKELGSKEPYQTINLQHLNGSNYQVKLPSLNTNRKAIEYYIEAKFDNNKESNTPAPNTPLRFPPTAPDLNQTLILFPTNNSQEVKER